MKYWLGLGLKQLFRDIAKYKKYVGAINGGTFTGFVFNQSACVWTLTF